MATPLQYCPWRIPWTEEPGGLQSIGSKTFRHNWSDLARCMHGVQMEVRSIVNGASSWVHLVPVLVNQNTSFGVPTCSVQFSRSVVSDSLWPHESQHARPPCPSPTPGVYSISCPLSLWSHLAISHICTYSWNSWTLQIEKKHTHTHKLAFWLTE